MVKKSEAPKPLFALPGDRAVFLFILAAYIAGRIPFLRTFDLVEYDGTYYINQAKSMLEGLLQGGAYPIGYPASIALLLPIVQDGVRAAQLVSFLAGIGAVWLLYELGRKVASRTSAFLVALVFAVTPLFIRASLTTLSESLFIFWTILGFYLFERGRGPGFGLSMGMAAITRPEGLGTFAALLLVRRRPGRRFLLAAAGFLAVYAVNVAVLSVALDRFVLLPKGESFGTTTSRWQARESWIDFQGREDLESRLEPEEGASTFRDAVARYPRELLLFARHVMPAAALLALFGVFKKRLFLLAGFFAFVFYPFYTPRSDPRYVLPYLPFALLYAAVGLDHIRRRGTRRLAGVLIVISTIAGLFSNRAQFLDPVSDGFQWAKRSGLAWRERLRDGDKVGDRKPYFSFYAGAEYVKIPLAPYDETIEHLAASHVKLLMLHRDTIDPLRPAIAPLLHNGAVIRGELRYRQVEVENGTYILYERTDARGTLQTERVTARVPGMLVTPSWSPDGRMLAYRWVSSSGAGAVLTVAVEGGESRRVFDGTGLIDPLTWSPDSKSICFATGEDETLDICALDLATGGLKRVVKHAAADRSPCWSKDGREIVFSSSRSGREEIWSQSLDTGEVTQLTHNGGNTLPALSPDGQRVALVNRARRLVILDRETGRTHVVGDPETVASAPAWSPDGRFIAVTSAERSGGADVYLIDSRGLQSLVLTKTTEGEGMPTWSPDGSRLAVVSNDSGDFGIWVLSGLEPYLERLTSTDPIETLSRMQ